MFRTCPFCMEVETTPFANTAFCRCKKCGLFINMPMTGDQIREKNKNFLLSACKKPETRVARIKEAHELQLSTLEKYTKPGRVYDVGCASGFFMRAAVDRGWEARGNEISIKGIEWAKENYNDLQIDYGFLEELQLPSNYYDAVVLWNTLEHTCNPKTTLDVCYDILKPNGLIYIKVPNNKTAAELIQHYEPVHLFEFTDECLCSHLREKGFEELYKDIHDVCPNYGVVAAVYLFRKGDV